MKRNEISLPCMFSYQGTQLLDYHNWISAHNSNYYAKYEDRVHQRSSIE